MADAILKRSDWTETFTASADTDPGAIIEAPSGRAGVVQGSRVIPSGEDGSLDVGENVYEIQSVNSSLNPATEDEVAWDESAGELVARASGDADFFVGTVVDGGQGAGNPVRVRFNVTAAPSVGP